MAELVSSRDGDIVTGQDENDILTAVHNDVTLSGGPGIDALESSGEVDNTTMEGGPGDDDLLGFGMNDTAFYANDPAAVTVNLSTQQATDGYGNTDLLFRIENVTGSDFADTLTGGSGANVLQGGGGNDTLKGGGGSDVFKYSFTLDQAAGEAKTFKFTDWLSEKYSKDFGDELPDFEHGHHHQHGKHDHHHSHAKHSNGKHDHHHSHAKHNHSKHDHHHHGKHGHNDHGKHHHAKHDHHHHKNGGCDDQPHQWGLSQKFFEKNYTEWLRDVVVADLLAQGLVSDTNGNGKIDIKLNHKDPGGTPRIEGLSDEQLAQIFENRDEVTLRHKFHEHDRWYSNSYKSEGGDGETTVSSGDGFDTILDFVVGEDRLEFDGLEDLSLAEFQSLFALDRMDAGSTTVKLADGSWRVTLEGVTFDEAMSNDGVFAELFGVGTLDSLFS